MDKSFSTLQIDGTTLTMRREGQYNDNYSFSIALKGNETEARGQLLYTLITRLLKDEGLDQRSAYSTISGTSISFGAYTQSLYLNSKVDVEVYWPEMIGLLKNLKKEAETILPGTNTPKGFEAAANDILERWPPIPVEIVPTAQEIALRNTLILPERTVKRAVFEGLNESHLGDTIGNANVNTVYNAIMLALEVKHTAKQTQKSVTGPRIPLTDYETNTAIRTGVQNGLQKLQKELQLENTQILEDVLMKYILLETRKEKIALSKRSGHGH